MKKKSNLIIYHEDYLLLLKKIGKKEYSFLGGHLDKNEDPKSAVIREAYEEGNILVDKNNIHYFDSKKQLGKKHLKTIHYFICNQILEYRLMEPHKFETLQWVRYNEARLYLKPHNRKVLDKLFLNVNRKAV